MELYNPSVIRGIKNKYGFKFSKSLGQNFLTDRSMFFQKTARKRLFPHCRQERIHPQHVERREPLFHGLLSP